jgi:hypothetical protein
LRNRDATFRLAKDKHLNIQALDGLQNLFGPRFIGHDEPTLCFNQPISNLL